MLLSRLIKKIKRNRSEEYKLNKLDTNVVPFFDLNGEHHVAKVTRVIDGDTIECVFYFKENPYKWKVRFYDINAPETRTKDKDEKKKGLKAKDYVKFQLDNQIVCLQCYKFDSFGRLLADIYINDENFNQKLIRLGYAEKYKVKT